MTIGGFVLASANKKQFARDEAPPVDGLVNVPMGGSSIEPGTKITAAHLAIGRRFQSKITPDRINTQQRIVPAPAQ